MIKLKQLTKAKLAIERWLGYDHREVSEDGAWWDECNLSDDLYPLMGIRRNRQQVQEIDGTQVQTVLAITGKEHLVWLDRQGRVWCNGNSVQLFPVPLIPWTVVSLSPGVIITDAVEVIDEIYPQAVGITERTVEITVIFDKLSGTVRHQWYDADSGTYHYLSDPEEGMLFERQLEPGDNYAIRIQERPADMDYSVRRTMVSMGAYVYIVPDNLYVNAVRLATGAEMTEGTDYGSVDNSYSIERSTTLGTSSLTLSMCDKNGRAYQNLSASDTAPATPANGDVWLDTSEETPAAKRFDAEGQEWALIPTTYIKISAEGIAEGFNAGDGVTLSSSKVMVPGDARGLISRVLNSSHVIELLQHSDATPENDFIVVPGILAIDTADVNVDLDVERKAPQMDFVVECNNRLWGCHYGPDDGGQILNEIYACKLGDFRNWRVYQGLSTDSYTASRGSDGPYTGAAVLDGHPLFFKRNCVEKVFPSTTGAHQIVTQTLDGVQPGSDRSLVVINDKLYYKSDSGIVCYTGAIPQHISAQLGSDHYYEASAGRHLHKYVVSMHKLNEDPKVFVYDTERGIWHVESEAWYDAPAITWEDRLYYVDIYGELWQYDAGDRQGIQWYAQSGILGLDVNQRKYISRINLRCKLDLGSTVQVSVCYNDSDVWQHKGTLWGNRRDTQTLVIWPRRCDTFRIRLEGVGGFRLYSLTYLRERGSDV